MLMNVRIVPDVMRMPTVLTQKGATAAVVMMATVEVAQNALVGSLLLAQILDLNICASN